MKKIFKLSALTALTILVSACGGGGGSDSNGNYVYTPPNLPPETISPEELTDFIPFDGSIFDAIKSLLGLTDDSEATKIKDNYDAALSHVIGEGFGNQPLLRKARFFQIYNMGLNSIKYPNLLCSETKTVGSVTTLSLKENRDSCIILDKSFKKDSSIIQTVKGNTTTIEFNKVRYGSNTDLSIKDIYLVSGSIKYTKNTNYEEYDILKLEFQRVSSDSRLTKPDEVKDKETASDSIEYLQYSQFKHSVTDSTKRYLNTSGTVIGQPYKADFHYNFKLTTSPNFEMNARAIGGYEHFPSAGKLTITHKYGLFGSRSVDTTITASETNKTNAAVSFNNSVPKNLAWTTILDK